MPAVSATTLLEALLGIQLAGTDPQAGNRVSLAGLALGFQPDGTAELAIEQLEVQAMRLASGPFDLPQRAPVLAPPAAPTARPSGEGWGLGPLAGANGTLRAQITDAHLLFDADVTVPIRQGQVRFNDATVEHVGPDSRMGVSPLGVYVDAPNGRSYLYHFPAAPSAGVEFERRGLLPGPWSMERGSLRLQEFAEGLLRQFGGGQGHGFSAQSLLLLDRTQLSGELRLGDGRFVAPGLQADLVGRAEGRNGVALHSEAVGRGLVLAIASLSLRDTELQLPGKRLRCATLTGSLKLRLRVEGAQLRLELDLDRLNVTGLRLVATKETP